MLHHPSVHSMSIVTDRSGHTVLEPGYENNRAYTYNEECLIQITIGGQALAGSNNPKSIVRGPQLDVILTDENREVVHRFMRRLFKTYANPRFHEDLLPFSEMCLASHLSDISNGVYPSTGKLVAETMNAAASENIHWETVKSWGTAISNDFDARKTSVNPNTTWNEQVNDIVHQQREASVTHLKKLHSIETLNKELLATNKQLMKNVDKLQNNFEELMHMFKTLELAQVSRTTPGSARKKRNLGGLVGECPDAEDAVSFCLEETSIVLDPTSSSSSETEANGVETIMTTEATVGIICYTVDRTDLLADHMANYAIRQYKHCGTQVRSYIGSNTT